jgi:hypothetical protein
MLPPQQGGEILAQAKFHHTNDIPPEIVERLINHHQMTWVSLSSDFRMQEDVHAGFRQPDFSSWVTME